MKMTTNVAVDRQFAIGKVDPRLFSGFIEHLGRAVYEGIYQPGHASADGDGMRADVMELIRELSMPMTRYPGGNFVSGYDWKDGVGPRGQRPVRLDLAWKALEPNQFGTNEFMDWCKKADTVPMMAVNLGTKGPEEAQALVEYCNHPAGSYWSDLRRQHGWEQPHRVKTWCLGNEMDGHWQTGHKTAEEYGRVAREAAKMMKWTDPEIELVVCGSSSSHMPTFGEWDATVLQHTYDLADYLSIHTYYNNCGNNTPYFLAMSDHMAKYIEQTVAICDYVGVCRKSDRKIMLSFDEWNVWYHSFGDEKKSPEWTVARPILEDIYNMEDALLVGAMLIELLNHADRVKIACLAQSVNVIAPIMTEKDGVAWRQTIFFPFALTSRYGRGTVLRQVVDGPSYDAAEGGKEMKNVKYLPCSVVHHETEKELTVFAVNRHLADVMELNIRLGDFQPEHVIEWQTMHHADLKAVNGPGNEHIRPASVSGAAVADGVLTAQLPAASWNMLRIKVK